MPTNYVMVDFENTQPDSLDELPVGAFKIKVFVGASQAKARVAMRFSMSMQRHGANAQYVEMTRSGPNAMDMHIAYFLGQLLAVEPDASVYIVSKDKDFDPLIEFLDRHGGRCTRVKSLAEIQRGHAPAPVPPRAAHAAKAAPRAKVPATKAPQPKAAPAKAAARPVSAPAAAVHRTVPADLDGIVRQLRNLKNKPNKRKSLAATIAAYFEHHGGARGDKAVEQVIEELANRRLISLSGTKVGYTLGT